MKYALGTGLLTCILTTSSAYAENDTCVALARIVGVNHTKYLAVDQQRSVAKADMCSASITQPPAPRRLRLLQLIRLYFYLMRLDPMMKFRQSNTPHVKAISVTTGEIRLIQKMLWRYQPKVPVS